MFIGRLRTLCASFAVSMFLAACGGGSGTAPAAPPSGAGSPPAAPESPSCTGTCTAPVQSHTAYGINADGTVSVFPVDTATGVLGTMTYIASGTSPSGIALHPSGNFLFVTDQGDSTLSAFAIDAVSGSLTAVATVATGTGPSALAVSPSGTALWVVNKVANTIDTFGVNAATGTVTHVATWPYQATPTGITVDAAGRNIYVSSAMALAVSHYAIDPATAIPSGGTMTFPSWRAPREFVIHPNGQLAWGFSEAMCSPAAYTIDPVNGALALGNDPGCYGADAWGAMHPSGNFLLMTAWNGLNSLAITPSTGAITYSSYVSADAPTAEIAIDPAGGHVYTSVPSDNTIRLFLFDPATGAFTAPPSGGSTATRTGPKALVIRRPPP